MTEKLPETIWAVLYDDKRARWSKHDNFTDGVKYTRADIADQLAAALERIAAFHPGTNPDPEKWKNGPCGCAQKIAAEALAQYRRLK